MTKNEFLDIFNDIDDEFLNELAAAQSRKNHIKEKRSSKEAEVVLRPKYYRLEPSSKSPLKKVMIAVTAVVCVVTAGVFVGVNSKRQMIPGDSTSSDEIYYESMVYDENDHQNPRVDYTKAEVKEIIEKQSNLKVSGDYFYASVPKTIHHVSKFYVRYPAQLEPKAALEDFETAFKYLFPERELDKRCLYYLNVDSDDSDDSFFGNSVVNVYDNYDFFASGLNGNWAQRSHFFYSDGEYPKANSVSFTARSPVGNDICIINKGVAQKISEKIPDGEPFHAYENSMLSNYFELVGAYPPDSEKKFMLLDKEMSIKDAVAFYESYIENIPSSVPQFYKIHVNHVEVYKIDEQHYGFQFYNSKIYDSIHFDFNYDGCKGSGTNRDLSLGTMVKSSDVDYIYATYRALITMEETRFDEFIPFEEAIRKMSEELTDYVNFEVTRAELIYRYSENIAESGNLGECKFPTKPAWKLTMINPNDDLVYTAYLDALDGEFECHQ